MDDPPLFLLGRDLHQATSVAEGLKPLSTVGILEGIGFLSG
jgi:hypothetical protein